MNLSSPLHIHLAFIPPVLFFAPLLRFLINVAYFTSRHGSPPTNIHNPFRQALNK